MNASYTPTLQEINNGFVNLVLTTTGNGTCPPDVDTVIINIDDFDASISFSVSDVSCFGGNHGNASVNLNGGTPPFSFLWDNTRGSQTSSSAINLAIGRYSVTITDGNGCSDTTTAIINEPSSLIASIDSIKNVSCFNGNDGAAFASCIGGTQPYTYFWPGGGSGAIKTNLPVGNYILTVTDANNCSDTISFSINQPTILNASLSSNPVSCFGGNDGSVTAVASGGIAPYTYNWSSNQTTPTITNLTAGTYSLILQDSKSCADTASVLVSEPTDLIATITLTNNVLCFGGSDGNAIVNASEGIPPYTYLWPSSGNLPNENNLSSGRYTVTITDSNGCSDSATAIINQPDDLVISISQTDVSCFGGNDGSVISSIIGGRKPYTYLWSNNRSDTSISNLIAGTYSLTVVDRNGCIKDTTLLINEPISLTINTSASDTICSGNNTIISASANGGNGIYTFSWDNGLGTGTTKNINPTSTTTYKVFVEDNKGCRSEIDSVTIYVRNLNNDSIEVFKGGDVCFGESTTVVATHNGPLGPYVYQWNTLGSGLGPFTVSPIVNTTYVFNVIDQCGFIITDSIEVIINPVPTINLPDTVSKGCSPLTVFFNDSLNPNFQNLSYEWNLGNGVTSNQPSLSYTYETAGVYQIALKLTSDKGCESESNSGGFVEVFPSPIANFTISPQPADISNPNITLTNTSTGESFFKWNYLMIQDSINQTLSVQLPDTGTYPVYLSVINQFGCVDTSFQFIRIDPVYEFEIPNAFSPNPNGRNGGRYNPNDLSNDVFFIFAEYVKDLHMMIFNRWGELIFESFDQNIGWDGYYQNKLCQQDVYVYKIEITWLDGSKSFKVGDVTLFR